MLLEILKKAYSSVEFDQLAGAMPAMLVEWFDVYTIDGHTRRKAESFLINALKYVDYPLSASLRRKARSKPTKPSPQGKNVNEDAARSSPNPRASDAQASQLLGTVRKVKLASGGDVTVMINVDLFELSDYDRDFVMKLTDQVRKYAVEAHHDEYRDKTKGSGPTNLPWGTRLNTGTAGPPTSRASGPYQESNLARTTLAC